MKQACSPWYHHYPSCNRGPITQPLRLPVLSRKMVLTPPSHWAVEETR